MLRTIIGGRTFARVRLVLAALLVVALFLPVATAHASIPAPRADLAGKSVGWLKTQINADGGFGRDANGVAKSGVSETANAIFAFVSAGIDPHTIRSGANVSPLQYLQTNAATATANINTLAKTILSVRAVGLDPSSFGGTDLYAKLNGFYNAASGRYGDNVVASMFAILALASGGKPIPPMAVTYLKSVQVSDGSWGFAGNETAGQGDSNDTAYALMALHAAGEGNTAGDIARAVAYLKTQQNTDGGFTFQKPSPYGTDSDTNSTAVVIQGLLAVGQDIGNYGPGGINPLDALAKLQNADGAFNFQTAAPGDNELATVQAIPALLEQPLPVKAVATSFTPGAGTATTTAGTTTTASATITATTATTAATTVANTTVASTTATTLAPETTSVAPTTTTTLPGGLPETGRATDTAVASNDAIGLLVAALLLTLGVLAFGGVALARRRR